MVCGAWRSRTSGLEFLFAFSVNPRVLTYARRWCGPSGQTARNLDDVTRSGVRHLSSLRASPKLLRSVGPEQFPAFKNPDRNSHRYAQTSAISALSTQWSSTAACPSAVSSRNSFEALPQRLLLQPKCCQDLHRKVRLVSRKRKKAPLSRGR